MAKVERRGLVSSPPFNQEEWVVFSVAFLRADPWPGLPHPRYFLTIQCSPFAQFTPASFPRRARRARSYSHVILKNSPLRARLIWRHNRMPTTKNGGIDGAFASAGCPSLPALTRERSVFCKWRRSGQNAQLHAAYASPIPVALAEHPSRNSAISNRYKKLLEFPVTYTKQTLGPHSNRYKNHFFATCTIVYFVRLIAHPIGRNFSHKYAEAGLV